MNEVYGNAPYWRTDNKCIALLSTLISMKRLQQLICTKKKWNTGYKCWNEIYLGRQFLQSPYKDAYGLAFTQVKNIWLGCCALGSMMTVWRQPEVPLKMHSVDPVWAAPFAIFFTFSFSCLCSHFRSHACRTNTKQLTILFQGPKIWNSLPNSITSIFILQSFKTRVFDFLFYL